MKNYFLLLAMLFSLTATRAQNTLSTAIREAFSNSFYAAFSGSIEAKMTNDRALVIVINSKSVRGEFDRAFVLTSEDPVKFPDFHSKNCDVFIHEDQKAVIILNNDDKTISIFGLDEADTKKVKTVLQENPATANYVSEREFLSFGLSYLEGRWKADSIAVLTHVNPFNYLAAADLTGRMMVVPADDGGSGINMCSSDMCDSGGLNSSACSIEQEGMPGNKCSVQCKTGYYACCNSKILRCYCCKDR